MSKSGALIKVAAFALPTAFAAVGTVGTAQAQSAANLPLTITNCTDVEFIPQDDGLTGLRTFFHTDKCRMTPEHNGAVDGAVANARAENPGQPLYAFVIGETDPRQTDAYNIRLGQGRANALARALRERGVTVLTVTSLGESRAPQYLRNNPEARASYAVIGNEAEIRACMAAAGCAVDRTFRSALRPD